MKVRQPDVIHFPVTILFSSSLLLPSNFNYIVGLVTLTFLLSEGETLFCFNIGEGGNISSVKVWNYFVKNIDVLDGFMIILC